MFVTWNKLALDALRENSVTQLQEESPKALDWHQGLMERDSGKKAFEAQEKAKAGR